MAAIAGKATGVAIRSPYIAWQVGKFLVKAWAFTLITAWNWLFFDDEDKELPEDEEQAAYCLGQGQGWEGYLFLQIGSFAGFRRLVWFRLPLR